MKKKLDQGKDVKKHSLHEHQLLKSGLKKLDDMAIHDPYFDSTLDQVMREFEREHTLSSLSSKDTQITQKKKKKTFYLRFKDA